MFEKPLIISGLNRQITLLSELIQEMEDGCPLKSEDNSFWYNRTRRVAANLRKLRQMEKNYRSHLRPDEVERDIIEGLVNCMVDQ